MCNFVGSADGKATAGGRTAPLAGAGDKAAFHLLRTQVDAVLAGTGTLGIERYGVPVRDERLVEIRLGEGRPAQPLTVIISRSGDIPFEIPLFADARSRIVLSAPNGTAVPDCAAEVTAHEVEPASSSSRSHRCSSGETSWGLPPEPVSSGRWRCSSSGRSSTTGTCCCATPARPPSKRSPDPAKAGGHRSRSFRPLWAPRPYAHHRCMAYERNAS